jgi:hypothetical protein
MTQDEVNLIHAYLHEHYDYKDGELIVKNDIPNGHKKGTKIGQFTYDEKRSPVILIHIAAHKDTLRLSHAIYIYHHKIKPNVIVYLDGNQTNTSIENLQAADSIPMNGYRYRIKKPAGVMTRKESKKGTYTVKVKRKMKQIYIGSFDDKERAREAYIYASELWDNNSYTHEEWLKEVRKQYPLKSTNKFIREIKRELPIGVDAHGNRFRSSISIQSKRKHLGVFATPQEAHEAYLKARKEYRGE